MPQEKHRFRERVDFITSPGFGDGAGWRERVGLPGGGPAAGFRAAALPMLARLPVAISRSTLPPAVRLASEQYPASWTSTPILPVICAWQAVATPPE